MPSWKKLGKIYTPGSTGRHPKLISHAANPLPIHLEGDVYRVFFSGRDKKNRSSVGAVDINIVTRSIVCEHHTPFFEHGPEGSFYASGVSIGDCYVDDGVTYILFMGWQVPEGGHWRGDIGRLVIDENLMTLKIDSESPFLGASVNDPISLSYPYVIEAEEGGYRMYYGSTVLWDAGNGEMLHVIKSAYSTDGLCWQYEKISVPYAINSCQAFSRPTIIKGGEGYDMWFSYRSGTGQTYRIGYAFSPNGVDWELDNANAGIDVSPEGWDSEMIEYPYVFDHKGRRYMLYNGNGYGKTGFGLAVLE